MFNNNPESFGRLISCALWLVVISAVAALFITALARGPG